MLGSDQEPVADDRRRRHGEVVKRIDPHEPVPVGRLDRRRLRIDIRFLETELLNSISNLIPVKAQQCGRTRLIAMRALERLDHEIFFHILQVPRLREAD